MGAQTPSQPGHGVGTAPPTGAPCAPGSRPRGPTGPVPRPAPGAVAAGEVLQGTLPHRLIQFGQLAQVAALGIRQISCKRYAR